MRVLLFGGTGQLGSELLAQGIAKGWIIYAPSVDEVDIQNIEAIKGMIAGWFPDLIINAAAYHGRKASAERKPQKSIAVNCTAVGNIAILAQIHHIPFITYSTGYVFAGDKGDSYEEDDTPCPINAYGLSKYMGELFARQCAPNFTTVIRTNPLFGGAGSFVLKILKHKKVKVSDEQIINPTYVKHLAAGTIQLIEKKAPAAIYHLVSEGSCSWAHLAMETTRLLGSSTKIIPVNMRGYSKGVYRPVDFSLRNVLVNLRGYGKGMYHRPLNSSLRNVRARSLGIMLPSWRGALKEYIKSLS